MALQRNGSEPVLDNTRVDNIVNQLGTVDELPTLSLDIPDSEIIKNLNLRINDSMDYWNNPSGYNLKNKRAENTRFHLGLTEERGLYKHQKQYRENQIFVGEESIIAYVTAQIAGPVVVPSSSEKLSKLFAADLEKGIKAYCEENDFDKIVEISVRNMLNKYVAIIKLRYDADRKEIVSEAIDPDHVVLDKNTALGANPGFVCHVLKMSVEEMCSMFPKKQEAIYKKLGIVRRTPKQMSQEIAVREVALTYYNKKNEPIEAIIWYFDDLVLEKDRNPNWLYASESKNLLKYPKKPYIFGNLINYGTHLIDNTSPVEQAIGQQEQLTKRGRQISEVADKSNGTLVISTDSGLSKDDAQNLIRDPNQKIMIKTMGQSVADLVHQIDPQTLPDFVVQDKLDARMQVGNIMGAPTDFTGSQADDGDPTLGEVMVKKNQAAGRQDMVVRAITRMTKHYYEYLVQMMIVYYEEDHNFVFDSGDGEFDFITLKRSLIEEGIRVKASKPASPDRSRIEAIALGLLKDQNISKLDAYKMLMLDSPQQLYDNWAKEQADPMSLARDTMDTVDQSEAYVAYQDIMAGKKVEVKENPDREYILSLRKLMINDKFLNAKKSDQKKFMDYVNKCIDSLQTRTSLDEMADQDLEELRPQVPIQPPQPQQPMMPGQQPGAQMPGQPPMGQPGMPQPMPMQQPPMMPPTMGAAPMMPPPQVQAPPMAPTPASVFATGPPPPPGMPPMV